MLSFILMYVCNNIVNRVPSRTFRLFFYRQIMKFEIENNASILMRTIFYGKGNLFIGENSVINDGCRIDNRGKIYIGSNVSISSESFIVSSQHDIQSSDFGTITRETVIGDYVFIGVRSLILPNVTLKEGCVVGAGSIVTKSFDEYSVIAGNPAKIIAIRNSKLDYQLSHKPFLQ